MIRFVYSELRDRARPGIAGGDEHVHAESGETKRAGKGRHLVGDWRVGCGQGGVHVGQDPGLAQGRESGNRCRKGAGDRCERFVCGCIRTLDADLGRVKTGGCEFAGQCRGDQGPVGDQVDPHIELFGVSDQGRKSGIGCRLPSGKTDGRNTRIPGDDLDDAHVLASRKLFARDAGRRSRAPRIAKPAGQVAAVGDGQLGENRQVREIDGQRFVDRGQLLTGQERPLEVLADVHQKGRHLGDALARSKRRQQGADGHAAGQQGERACSGLGDLDSLIGALDQEVILLPDKDPGFDPGKILIRPGKEVRGNSLGPGDLRLVRLSGRCACAGHQWEPPLTQAE